jgi:predicted nucleic acid-binding protein
VTDVFFDSNILLYLVSGDMGKASRVEELIGARGVISVQVLNEFVAVAVREASLKFQEVREILSTIQGLCTVRPVDIGTHELALDRSEQHHFSIYDALIVAAALQAQCTVLYTEDLQHNQRIGGLTIRNPFVGQPN